MYRCTKTYLPSSGLSCIFRQPWADSHCNQPHGYALGFRFMFQAYQLDKNGWVMDFGGLKPVKKYLDETFDHKWLVADDDPLKHTFLGLIHHGIRNIRVVHRVGCEAFANMTGKYVEEFLAKEGHHPRVELYSCEVFEHEGNSATWINGSAHP